ncbi:MAG: recombinase family protein [Opitutaceae bacterium]|nr:recombinase family protein [Opitutaceae bacterium]
MSPAPKAYSYTRFSSEKQRRGDSVRRQIEAAEAWCKAEGMNLSLDTSLRDEGVSGFKGRNLEVGALGVFLTAVRQGSVAPGSVLLVENLDRISRHDPLKAMHVLETIVEAGVDVVTLQDRRRYTRQNIAQDVSHLIVALITFARGNEESLTKSRRLCAVWGNKRREAAASRKVISTWVHPWIRVVGVKRYGTRADFSAASYTLNEDRAKVVRQIFEWAVSGWGYGRIAQELRARRVSPWGRAGWSTTRIAKVIKNRAVIGEYQPCRYEGGTYGKRVADGTPISDYFPRVVSDDQFAAAQPSVTGNPGGRPDKWIRLLSGLLEDAHGRPMHIHAHAGGTFPTYQTAANFLTLREKPVRWSAEHLERCVISACGEINWGRLFLGDTKERDRLETHLENLTREETTIKRKLANAAQAVLEGGAFGEAVKAQVQQLEQRLQELRKERDDAHDQLDGLRRASASTPTMFTREIPSDPALREKLRAELRAVLTKIKVWPDGRTPDSFWKLPLEYATESAPKTAKLSISQGRVMGAVRLFFKNGRAITAYVTFVRVGKNRAANIIAFANPLGMTIDEWDRICSFAGMYAEDKESASHVPTTGRSASTK